MKWIKIKSSIFGGDLAVKIEQEVDGGGKHFLRAGDELRSLENKVLFYDGVQYAKEVICREFDKDQEQRRGELIYEFVKKEEEKDGVKREVLKKYKKKFDTVKPGFSEGNKVNYEVEFKGKGLLIVKRTGKGEKHVLDRVFVNQADGVVYRNRKEVGNINF